MKKNSLYIIGAVIVLLVFIFITVNMKKQHAFDERVTLNRKYKSPYGLYITYNLLGSMFAGSQTNVSRVSPLSWDNKGYIEEGKTLMFLVSRQFNPTRDELDYLNEFVKSGNQVFICTSAMSSNAKSYFNIEEESYAVSERMGFGFMYDSANSVLLKPPFPQRGLFFNPGFTYNSFFRDLDSNYSEPLGRNKVSQVNYFRKRSGKGSFFFHSNPFLFANYFLLHKDNVQYLESVLSLVPGNVKKIIWDEYFVYKLPENENVQEPSPLRILWKYPAFRWALLLALSLLGMYVLLNIKRLQRIMPVVGRPRNESLDFITTIGRLYYEKGDHANLAKKMVIYFLDYVRNRYGIKSAALDDEYSNLLSAKTGFEEGKANALVQQMAYIQSAEVISEQQLIDLYSGISSFYKQVS